MADPVFTPSLKPASGDAELSSSVACDFHPSALADIYHSEVNIAIWQRSLAPAVMRFATQLMRKAPHWQTRFIQAPSRVADQLLKELPAGLERPEVFIADLALVVDMFGCLFELDQVGLRLAVLHSAMCPKFHVDRVPCRLICTYAGEGSEWLTPDMVRRSEDGAVKPAPNHQVMQLGTGDVALLKGEAWEGNEGRGLVHRSPQICAETPRLVLTLDFA